MKKRFLIAALMLSISVSAINSQINKSKISGKVLKEWGGDTDIPITNASIYLQRSLPTGGMLPYFIIVDSVKTDSKGNYSFDSAISDSYLLTFTARGYRTEQVFATVKQDTVINTDLVVMTKFYNLRGKITIDCPECNSIFPAPLPGCTVSVYFPQNYTVLHNEAAAAPFLPISQWAYSAVTGIDGTYLIDSIPADTLLPDSVQVRAMKTGYLTKGAYKKLNATKTDTLNFSLVANKTGIWKPAVKAVNNEQIMSFSAAARTLKLNMNRAQSVSVNVFSPDGKLICNVIQKRNLHAGQHSFSLQKKKLGSGIVMIRAVGDNFNDAIKVIIN